MPRKKRETKAPASALPANIKFCGRGGQQAPLARISNGERTLQLPPVAEQTKPFYHPEARLIVRLFPGLYKLVKAKG